MNTIKRNLHLLAMGAVLVLGPAKQAMSQESTVREPGPTKQGKAAEEYWDRSVLGYDFPRGGGLFGDMGGLRSSLSNKGFNFGLAYTAEMAYNAVGGYNTSKHLGYVDQVAFLFFQDLERYTGIPGATIEGLITDRNHDDNLTTERVQDPRAGFNDLTQEVWGGGSISRLGYLTFSRTFDDKRLQWRIGAINYQQTFDQILPCDFQVLSLCGGKTGNALLWNTWNIHTLGTTLAYALTPALTLKTGVLKQNPEAANYSRAWSFNSAGSKGILVPLEAEYKAQVNGLPGLYNIGALYTNAKQSDLYTPPGGTTQSYDHTWFFWGGFNQQVTHRDGAMDRGMSLSGSWSVGDQRSNPLRYTASVSMRYRGLFDASPNDMLGVGVAWIDMSRHLSALLGGINAANGITDYANPQYIPVPGHSVTVDLFYRYRPVPWLDIQPDIQYWINPGAINETKSALVLGLKTMVRF